MDRVLSSLALPDLRRGAVRPPAHGCPLGCPHDPAPAPAPGYRPRSAQNDLKDLVEDYLEELFQVWDQRFRESHGPLPARIRMLLERFLRCGDLHFGFLRLRCTSPDCPEKTELLVPHSCKVRGLCPSCSQKRALLWAERLVEEVLPLVPYRQLVFTIPRALRPAFLRDRSLYADLARVAYASTRDFLRSQAPRGFPRFQRAVPAMLVVPQSFGDLLLPHPHAHALCSLGLFTHDGAFLPVEEVDFSGLEEIFRQRFLQLLLRRAKILPETAERLQSWEHSGFNLGWERKLERHDRHGLQGLLSYMERAPVSLKRLTYRDDGMVHYQGTKVHPRLGIDHQLLPALDFLALLVPHILLRYQVSARLYGAISTRSRKQRGWIEHPPTHSPPPEHGPAPLFPSPPPLRRAPKPPPPRVPFSQDHTPSLLERRRNWARLIHRTWLSDPELCPVCGQRMKVIAAITSPLHDHVIEKILRSIGRWDPPWKRLRRARGPPAPDPHLATSAGQDLAATATIDPHWDFETYIVDPPGPEVP